MKIAILGSTSHIAQSLIPFMQKDELHLLGRLDGIGADKTVSRKKENPLRYSYDMIINCVGVRKSENVNFSDYFFVTEAYDNVVLQYLEQNPKTKYIFFSTGAVNYFKGVQDINKENYCAISKINAEAKHRSLSHLNIVDLRLYSYFTKHSNLNEPYFLNEAVLAVKENKILTTDRGDFYRNYIHPKDLYDFIISVEGNGAKNIGSRCEIQKLTILNFLKKEYGLKWEVKNNRKNVDITGSKTMYFPMRIDNNPLYTSYEAIKEACHEILGR